jgi:hypothetical protein
VRGRRSVKRSNAESRVSASASPSEDECRVEELAAVAVARLKELMRMAGVEQAALSALSCLPDLGGDGAGIRGDNWQNAR